jgi:serine phosphatase RsbU (regulator of sigma subunit)
VAAVVASGESDLETTGQLPPVSDGSRKRGLPPGRAAVIVALVGLVVTLSVSGTAWTLNRHNEHRLLEVQTRQAAAVLSATILSLRGTLDTALQVESATGGSTTEFSHFAASYVGPGLPFMSAVLFRSNGTTWQPVAVVGARPLMAPSSPQAQTLVSKATKSSSFVVAAVPANNPRRIGYAIANPKEPTVAVYVERAIPVNRVVPVESSSAFSDLDFATYFGRTTSTSALATTDLPLTQLPITGDAVRISIPFGNSSVTLVTAPRKPLGGALGGALPLVLLVAGLLLTLGATAVTYQLVRSRHSAEQDAQTIATLYQQLDSLFDEQLSISETLQRALLPQRNPAVSNLEIASQFLAGTDGVEIGGDWFSLIEIDERHFAFAVGDVSGKGVDAVAIMARLRFTIRAYLTEGHPPDVVLEMCSRQLSVIRDGHIATVLIGVGDTDSGVVTMANAGHLNPLQVAGTTATFLRTDVGLPLGVAPGPYTTTTVQLASGSALVAFTDGLVERRGESIDVGMKRLMHAAADPVPTIDDLLTNLISTLGTAGSDDDIAILAFRWTRPEAPDAQPTELDPVD